MDTKEEKSPPRAADSVSVFIGDTLGTSNAGSVVRAGLEEGSSMTSEGFSRISKSSSIPTPAEAKDSSPVASGLDSTPTNWFELAVDLCHSGHITETRMRRAVDAVRKAVQQ